MRGERLEWVGDAKLGRIDIEQGKAFVAEAATSTLRLLVYFVPDETVGVPQELIDFGRNYVDARDRHMPVKVIAIPVHGFSDWIPRLDARRSNTAAPAQAQCR